MNKEANETYSTVNKKSEVENGLFFYSLGFKYFAYKLVMISIQT